MPPLLARACCLTLLALAALAAGCGGGVESVPRPAPTPEPAPVRDDPRPEPPLSRGSVAPMPPPAAAPAKAPARPARQPAPAPCADASIAPLRTTSVAFAATVRSNATAYATPGGRRIADFGRLNVNGVPTVFGVLGRSTCRGEWLRVQLPMRPNGALGWVRAGDVEVARVRTRIEVDLSERRVTLLRRGRPLLETRAAIGAADTPTPTGSYYVNQRLVAPDPSGPYGPAAIGISAFSPVLQHWVQGGPIAIHGTNQPHLLGGAVSHGCVRVRNDLLVRMFELAVPGTPVVIRA